VISVVVISKDEPALDATLRVVAQQTVALGVPAEIIVVDASDGRVDHIRASHPSLRWIAFERPPGVRITIPHQRNRGVREARGDVIVFTDCGCHPRADWLASLVAPILRGDEQVVAGIVQASGGHNGLYDTGAWETARAEYLEECPTGNVAFVRAAFERIGGFDEAFEYGSDLDFSWRLVDAGLRIRSAPESIVEHEWGGHQRQLRRSYLYGRAKFTLYAKHRRRLRTVWRSDPMVIVYPAFLLGLPLALRYPLYLALLAIPAWRNRDNGVVRVLADHLAFGAGVLSKVVRM
jgi:glycosyltransferase involved in cell wall biosynthesis